MKRLTAMTQQAELPACVRKLRDAAADPMWSDHYEGNKKTALEVVAVVEQLIEALAAAAREAGGANAQLTSAVLNGDAQYAVRDSKLASHHLERLQNDVRAALIRIGC